MATSKPKSAVTGDSAASLIRNLLPDVVWMLSYAEKGDGWIRLPPTVFRVYTNLKLENYVELYEDERKILTAILLGFFGEENIASICQDLCNLSPQELADGAKEICDAIDQLPNECLRLPRTESELEAARLAFDALPDAEKNTQIRRAQFIYSGFLASFFQYICVMVHGEKLTSLVRQAIEGSDIAFAKAIQIDRNLLTSHQVFSKRMAQAQLLGEGRFLEEVSYRMRNPIVRGKIRHRELWFALAILDGLGMLNGSLTHRELIDVLQSAHLDLKKNGIEDEGYFAKRLKQYREFQTRGAIATH